MSTLSLSHSGRALQASPQSLNHEFYLDNGRAPTIFYRQPLLQKLTLYKFSFDIGANTYSFSSKVKTSIFFGQWTIAYNLLRIASLAKVKTEFSSDIGANAYSFSSKVKTCIFLMDEHLQSFTDNFSYKSQKFESLVWLSKS